MSNLVDPQVTSEIDLPPLMDQRQLLRRLHELVACDLVGSVHSVGTNLIRAAGLSLSSGARCLIGQPGGRQSDATVVGFDGEYALLAPWSDVQHICPGDPVRCLTTTQYVPVGETFLGRVIDAGGRVLDEQPAPQALAHMPLEAPPLPAMQRAPVDQMLRTGVRAVDALLTLGRGQRVGICAGAGVGKSKLLGMIARGTDADVVVLALIGERGREVREFLQRELTADLRRKCVTVVATSDQVALQRIQAAQAATAVAEYFRNQGKHVLLLMDSLTRCATAQRELGLAAGETAATHGFPPSVFSMLPRLVERAGNAACGSITGVYTILMEGDNPHEPVTDTLRGLLDGHIVLSRHLANQGHFPAVDILSSLSRLAVDLHDPEHNQRAVRLRTHLADYRDHEDLISIGAYQEGANPRVDQALSMRPRIAEFLRQAMDEVADWMDTQQRLQELLA